MHHLKLATRNSHCAAFELVAMVKDYSDTLSDVCDFLSECTAVVEVPDRMTWTIREREPEREERLSVTHEAPSCTPKILADKN
jgi:hypothetical protein